MILFAHVGLGFDAAWLLYLGAGLLGALLRRVTSRVDTGMSTAILGDFVVGAAVAALAPTVMRLLPITSGFVDKLDPAEWALVVLALSYVAGHVFAARIRTQAPELIARALDRVRGTGPPKP